MAAIANVVGHIKYIQYRRGKDVEEGRREMFTETEDSADAKELRQRVRDFDGQGVVAHKLMIAPEINADDPKAFTREVMQKLGAEKGLDLEWWAVCHRNTEHHHVHVVVMPKDRDGKLVRFYKEDYNRLKGIGDDYLKRTQYAEFQMAEIRRQEKKRLQAKERRQERERARQERIRNGEELPWLHKQIVREQLQPCERGARGADEPKESFEYAGKQYSNKDPYEKLAGLSKHLHSVDNKALRLPNDHYKQLQSWIDKKHRSRFAGEIERQLDAAKNSEAAQARKLNSPHNNRYQPPLQQEFMRNPVMGLFMTAASIAADITRSIPLVDNRDRLKEQREDLEKAKVDREDKLRGRTNEDHRVADEEVIEKLDQAIEENKKSREERDKEKERSKERRDRGLDFMR